MPETKKEFLGKESLRAIRDYIDSKPSAENKADKVSGGNTDNKVAGLDSTGNLKNSNIDIDNVVIKNIDNNFSVTQTFNGNIRTNYTELSIMAHDVVDTGDNIDVAYFDVNTDADDNYIGTSITASGHFTALGDNDDANTDKPDDETSFSDLDTDYFNTGVTLRNSGADNNYKLSFPAKSGIFATTDDITNIEIVDLTQINN